MPHAVEAGQPARSTRTPKVKASLTREVRQLHILYNETKNRYLESSLRLSINRLLESRNRPVVTKVISLGLGSLSSVDQARRIKQLTIFLAITEQLRRYETKIEIYAQDPSFSKTDEAFLESLGVHILTTPSATELGEAAQHIDKSTLVYSPFLTLEACQLLFATETINFLIGDDFDALRIKWPKNSAGRKEAESLLRRFVQGFRKRVIAGDNGFWDVEDKPFPMAIYSRASDRYQEMKLEAKL
jgi:predicted component of type VI protein secretion system